MKFILMMHARKGAKSGFGDSGDWNLFSWPPSALQKHLDFLNALNADLEQQGVLVGIAGLAPPGHAKLVKAGGRKGLPLTDGPFPESKEFLAGWWMVDVERPEDAYAIAARASAAPGPDGKPLNMGIEVRQVLGGPAPKKKKR